MKPGKSVLSQFGIAGEAVFLPGGEGRTYRVKDIVLRHIKNDSESYVNWAADLFAHIEENGFRVSRPVLTKEDKWITQMVG